MLHVRNSIKTRVSYIVYRCAWMGSSNVHRVRRVRKADSFAYRDSVWKPQAVVLTVHLGAVRAAVEENSRRASVIDLVVVYLHIVAALRRDNS